MRIDNKVPIKVEDNRIIKVAYILDSSGSMQGSKYDTAVQTLKAEVNTLLDSGMNYSFTINEFSNTSNFLLKNETLTPAINAGLNKIRGIYGGTALYDAIGETLTYLKETKKPDESVLVSILTDGQEEHSFKYGRAQINSMIKESEQNGFTINFIGTKFDADKVVRDLGIKWSNIATHDNTASSIGNTVVMRTSATLNYSKKLMRGEAVTEEFYSNK